MYIKSGKLCPRLVVRQGCALYAILGEGQHALGLAIPKIHKYGYKKPIPCEARQVLTMFNEIQRCYDGSPYVSLLDPQLYVYSDSRSQAQSESFRKKEWGWLALAGFHFFAPSLLDGFWDLLTIQVDYVQYRISFVLSRDGHLINLDPGPKAFEVRYNLRNVLVRYLTHSPAAYDGPAQLRHPQTSELGPLNIRGYNLLPSLYLKLQL